jgi:hypothetical protein
MALVHEIVLDRTRLRVERDRTTGEHAYFVNDQRRDVNAYLAVTQAHQDSAGTDQHIQPKRVPSRYSPFSK